MEDLFKIEALIDQIIREDDPERLSQLKGEVKKLISSEWSALRVLQEMQSLTCAYVGLKPKRAILLTAEKTFERERAEKALDLFPKELPKLKECFNVRKHRDLLQCFLNKLNDPVFKELRSLYKPGHILWLTDLCQVSRLK